MFIYEKYSYEIKSGNLEISFLFKIEPDIYFEPKIIIENIPVDTNLQKLDNLIFHLGLMEIPSYWKATCSPIIEIRASYLDKEQIKWWHDLIIKGMGQFFYENKIDWRKQNFLRITCGHPMSAFGHRMSKRLKNRCLVPFAGGRDSIVTLESLKKKGEDIALFTINPIEKIQRTVKVSGVKKQIIVRRIIDKKLLELNKKGYLNGHTPFSSVLSFISVLCAVIFDYKNIAFSNEKSAEEGNVKYLGRIINHQWAKSLAFEKMFKFYIKKYLTPGVEYFSYLRKYGELEISKMFIKYPQYFPVFSSCNNRGVKWCGNCPKCLFVYAALYPYLNKKELNIIFGKNIFENKKLLPVMKDMIEEGRVKPFECVGTKAESRLAFKLCLQKAKQSGKIPYLLKKNIMLENFKNKKIVILGFGKEGRDTLLFLKKLFPKKKIGIADQKFGKDYLDKIGDYDVIIKSPGIPFKILPKSVLGRITSQTEIFFDNCPGKIVGITGTKGKSTTTSLIYDILKACPEPRRRVHLVGNIGKPVLNLLFSATPKDVYVYELSSFQLTNLKKSPHIAVLLNIYQEHLDYYRSFKEYVKAKANITLHQTSNDYLIYNSGNKLVSQIAQKSTLRRGSGQGPKKIAIKGEYYGLDRNAARAVGEILRIPKSVIEKAIKNFKPLSHRLELVGTFKGITFYDDAIATIPEATIAAINQLGGNVQTIMLGGYDRGIDFRNLAKAVLKSKIKNIILFPTSGQRIWNELKNKKYLNNFFVNNMPEAVKLAYQHTEKGKICLLSCASASYSIFRDYIEKGDLFKKYVKIYGKKT